MTRRMLINAQRTEELRVAIVSGNTLDNYEVAAAESGLCRGNIYRGVVVKLQPSLSAAWVDFGAPRDGLLRADDVMFSATSRKTEDLGRHPPIEKLLDKGQQLVVQVTRDAMGTKGAVVTTNVSIAGRYLVLMPYDDIRGVSRKLEDDDVRSKIRERVRDLNVPEGIGVIARTNAGDQTKKDLNRDLNALLRLWKRVRSEAGQGKGPRLLYSDQDLIVQALRDHLDSSIDEILIDDEETFQRAADYMKAFMPRARVRLIRYDERMPLFSKFNLEEQIDRIYMRKVELPSGGSIVIDGTEALTAIDVNSGRAQRGASQEETAYKTNLEAAREVARQLRLRDIGGLLVVDFIDMRSSKHQRAVEKELREALKEDRARTSIGRISSNGLLEINRQRIKQALQLRTHRPCPTCGGGGTIASPELVGLNLLRRIETRAVTGRLKEVRVSLHPELADALQNSRRQEIAALEREFEIRVEIIAATSLHRSEEKVEWIDRAPGEDAASTASAAALSAADLAGDRRQRSRDPGRQGRQESQPKEPKEPEKASAKNGGGGDGDGDAPAAESTRKRRRRRGGRRRKKSAKGSSAGSADGNG